jgi:formate hydrogenlyase transcriptional activator
MDYTENRGIRPAAVDGARTLEFVTSAASAAARHPMTDQLRVLQSAIAVAPCGMAVCNRFGRLLLANRALGEIFGYAPADLLPRNLRTIIPDIVFAAETPGPMAVAAPAAHAPAALVVNADAARGREVEGIRKDGATTLVRVAVAPIASQSEWLFVVSIVDLSERQRVASQVSLLQRQTGVQGIVTALATRCAAAAFDDLDAALTEVLRDVGEGLALDRCVAYVPATNDANALAPAYAWTRNGGLLPSDAADAWNTLPGLLARARLGEATIAAALDDLEDATDRASLAALGARACAALPLDVNGARGALVVDTLAERTWPAEIVDSLRLVAAVMSQSLARKHDRERLNLGLDELRRQRDETAGENAVLRRETAVLLHTDRSIASQSVAIRRVVAQVQQVAPTTATVLLLGETGAGKEVFAQAIHNMSPRQRRAMIRVSCAAIPTALIESELFGRERGAFTGALSRQIGRFEAAHGSTIFLDEIGDLPLEIQVKLLRVLQERTVERLGGNQSTKVDVRVIAATNRNLEQAVANGTFREDLFYRLNVFPITIPPLRERVADIPSLVWTFVDEFSHAFGKKVDAISKESIEALQRYAWPGNVRELRNVIEREMIVATGSTLTVAAPRPVASERHAPSSRLADIEVEHNRSVLDSCGWRVRGIGGAAERLGVKPTTLESRMARLGIAREKKVARA